MSAECVYGALLGTQKGRSVEICNSFELVVTLVDGSPILDRDYFTEKEEQCELYVHNGPVRECGDGIFPQFVRFSLVWSF